MSSRQLLTPEEAIKVAEGALGRSRGRPVVIRGVRQLGGDQRRNLVLRASAVEPDGNIRPIVVKATRDAAYEPSAPTVLVTSGLAKEWTATMLLAGRNPGGADCATLLAADLSRGVLVFDDLGEDLPSLVQPLTKGPAADTEAALTAYARSLARLHATTLGCEADHAGIARTGFPAATVPSPGRNWIERIALKAPAMLGGHLPDEELALMARRLLEPGPWSALVHGDPCPDNVLLAPDGTAKLIDFEFAAPGHALMDAAYWRMGFPTCWCAGRVPEAVADRIETAYRAAIAPSVPMAADDGAFRRESAIIAAAWLLGSLAWLGEGALREDDAWGLSTNRNRILHYLDVAITATENAGVLPSTRRAAAVWREELRIRWPASAPLALYPSFAGSSTAAE